MKEFDYYVDYVIKKQFYICEVFNATKDSFRQQGLLEEKGETEEAMFQHSRAYLLFKNGKQIMS